MQASGGQVLKPMGSTWSASTQPLPLCLFAPSNYKLTTISNYHSLHFTRSPPDYFFISLQLFSSNKNMRGILGCLELLSARVGNHFFNICILFLPPMVCGQMRRKPFVSVSSELPQWLHRVKGGLCWTSVFGCLTKLLWRVGQLPESGVKKQLVTAKPSCGYLGVRTCKTLS